VLLAAAVLQQAQYRRRLELIRYRLRTITYGFVGAAASY
jgi:hypothetical protein